MSQLMQESFVLSISGLCAYRSDWRELLRCNYFQTRTPAERFRMPIPSYLRRDQDLQDARPSSVNPTIRLATRVMRTLSRAKGIVYQVYYSCRIFTHGSRAFFVINGGKVANLVDHHVLEAPAVVAKRILKAGRLRFPPFLSVGLMIALLRAVGQVGFHRDLAVNLGEHRRIWVESGIPHNPTHVDSCIEKKQ